MPTNNHMSSGFSGSGAEVEIRLPVIIFREGISFIAHIPGLDLSGYGYTEEEAKESLDVVVNDYLEYTIRNHTLHSDLIKHGFVVADGKKLIQPEPSELLKNNEEFNNLVKSKPFHKTDKSVHIPAYC